VPYITVGQEKSTTIYLYYEDHGTGQPASSTVSRSTSTPGSGRAPCCKAIEIVAFVPAASIDPVRLSGGSYFLQYDGPVAAKPYALIARALARNTKVAVAKLAWHGRERLVLLRVRDGALVAHVLKWDDEVRDPSEQAPKEVTVTDSETDEALQLVDSMTTDDISGYRDEYRQALEKVIEAKAEGGTRQQNRENSGPTGTRIHRSGETRTVPEHVVHVCIPCGTCVIHVKRNGG
jgi:hypothetical protein